MTISAQDDPETKPSTESTEKTEEFEVLLEAMQSPLAIDRSKAFKQIRDKKSFYRKVLLRDDVGTRLVIDALVYVGKQRKKEDISRIARWLNNLDEEVQTAALEAVSALGRDAIATVQAMTDKELDAGTKKQVLDILVEKHVIQSCLRDANLNKIHTHWSGRFDELYSIDYSVDDVLFRLLRENLSEIRDELAGQRNYWYRPGAYVASHRFLDYGALAIAALAKRQPERLIAEVEEFAEIEDNDNGYYYYYRSYSNAVTELAIVMARRGKPALVEKILEQLDGGSGWGWGGDPDFLLGREINAATLESQGLQDTDVALARIESAIESVSTGGYLAIAQYSRARLLMEAGQHGAALNALEDAAEASEQPPLLILVDDVFEPLAKERRFQRIQRFCKLASRRMNESQRPWDNE